MPDDTRAQRVEGPHLLRFPARGHAIGKVLVLPALGVPARFYTRLAEQLAECGLEVSVLELRGIGDSPLRASRRCDFGFAELLDEDIPAALHSLGCARDDLPVWLLGHSLGGHLAVITAGRMPEEIDGLMLVACGSPWRDAYHGATRRRIDALCALIPVCNALLGYFPGDRIGFGGRQPRRLMRDWRALALTGRYSAEGIDEDLDAGLAHYAGSVLSLRMAEDTFAPESAVRAVTGKLTSAVLESAVIDAAELGQPADHFRWAKQPEVITHRVADWCTRATQGTAT